MKLLLAFALAFVGSALGLECEDEDGQLEKCLSSKSHCHFSWTGTMEQWKDRHSAKDALKFGCASEQETEHLGDLHRALRREGDGELVCQVSRNDWGKLSVECLCDGRRCNRHKAVRRTAEQAMADASSEEGWGSSSEVAVPRMQLSAAQIFLSFGNVREALHVCNTGAQAFAYTVDNPDTNIQVYKWHGIVMPGQRATVWMCAPQCFGLSRATLKIRAVAVRAGESFSHGLFARGNVVEAFFDVCY